MTQYHVIIGLDKLPPLTSKSKINKLLDEEGVKWKHRENKMAKYASLIAFSQLV